MLINFVGKDFDGISQDYMLESRLYLLSFMKNDVQYDNNRLVDWSISILKKKNFKNILVYDWNLTLTSVPIINIYYPKV